MNAVKHGILAKQLIISEDESRPFNKLAKKLIAELQPQTSLEMILAEQVVVNYWRLLRCMKLENELLAYAGEPKFSFDNPKFIVSFSDYVSRNTTFDTLTRYNSTILRSFYRSLREYGDMKSKANPAK